MNKLLDQCYTTVDTQGWKDDEHGYQWIGLGRYLASKVRQCGRQKSSAPAPTQLTELAERLSPPKVKGRVLLIIETDDTRET